MQQAPIVFVNDERVGVDDSHISARDRGLTLADGLFETMRARCGVVFRLDRHRARLRAGLEVLHIAEPTRLWQTVEHAVSIAGATDLSIRVTVTRGPGPGGLTPPVDVPPTVIVTVSPMPRFPTETYTRGLRAVIASGRRNSRSSTTGVKTLAYTDAVVAFLEAQQAGADEAIFLDEDDHCSEATASNLFVHVDGRLVTPPLSCAALPGITRATVLELAAADGIPAAERAFALGELDAAQEVFLTSSLRGLAPVTSIGGRAVGSGSVGPITSQLTTAYSALIERECGRR
jgi:branched-chain amino acid aminotransferase